MCQEIREVEWSGVLFYTLEGSIKQPETCKLIVQDILPMDKGTAGHTDFKWDERFIDYLMEDEARQDWITGLIHSHNRMSVFFSGEDWSELHDNCPNHNFYLSLIVNNAMEMCAKVAIYVKADLPIPQVPFIALDENGENYTLAQKDFEVVKHQMYVFDCQIDRPVEAIVVDDTFKERVAGIIEKEAKEAEAKKAAAAKAQQTYQHNGHYPPKQLPQTAQSGKSWSRTDSEIHKRMQKQEKGHRTKRGSFIDQFNKETDFQALSEPVDMEPIEWFCVALFKYGGAKVMEDDTLEDELDVIKHFNIEPADLAVTVMDHYATVYDRYFPDADDQEFISDAEMVADIIEEQVEEFPFVQTTVNAIRAMAKKLEEHGDTIPTA